MHTPPVSPYSCFYRPPEGSHPRNCPDHLPVPIQTTSPIPHTLATSHLPDRHPLRHSAPSTTQHPRHLPSQTQPDPHPDVHIPAQTFPTISFFFHSAPHHYRSMAWDFAPIGTTTLAARRHHHARPLWSTLAGYRRPIWRRQLLVSILGTTGRPSRNHLHHIHRARLPYGNQQRTAPTDHSAYTPHPRLHLARLLPHPPLQHHLLRG